MKLRVILFEDDATVREAIKRLISREGHEVLAYPEPAMCPIYTGPDCICPAEEACADVIITDNHMPHMSGLEFISQQEQRGCKGVIRNKAIMSGSWSAAELIQAELLGCKVFFKPVDLRDFSAWLKNCETTVLPGRKLSDIT